MTTLAQFKTFGNNEFAYDGACDWADGTRPAISSNEQFDVLVHAKEENPHRGALVTVFFHGDEGSEEWTIYLGWAGDRTDAVLWAKRTLRTDTTDAKRLAFLGFRKIGG